MWQEETVHPEDRKQWNVPFPIGHVLANSHTLCAKSFLSDQFTTSVGSPPGSPTPVSEGSSCISSLSECAGSPSKNNSSFHGLFEKMNPVTSSLGHDIHDDPDANFPPPSSNNWWTSMLLPSTTQSQHSPSATAISDLDTLNWSSDLATTANCDPVEQLTNSVPSTTTADYHQRIGAASAFVDSSLSMGSSLSGMTDSSLWSQVLFGSANSEAMQGLTVESLQDALFSRVLRQGSEFLLHDHAKRPENIPSWDLPLRSFTFQGDDMSLAALDNKHNPTFQYSQLMDTERFNNATCTLPEMEIWPAAASHDHNNDASQGISLSSFSSGLQLPRSQYEHPRIKQENPLSSSHYEQPKIKREYVLPTLHNEHARMKQEFPIPYGGGSSTTIAGAAAPFWLQTFGVDTFKDVILSQQHLPDSSHKSRFRTLIAASNFATPSIGDDVLGKWPGSHSSRFPPILPHTLPSVPASKQPAEMLAFRNNFVRHSTDVSSLRSDMKPSMRGIAPDRSSSLQYIQQSMEGKPVHDVSSCLGTMGQLEEIKETASDPKRNAGSLKSSDGTSESLFKRSRVEQVPPNLPYKQQARKEKLGDRITALQQLVSPFGKTDTASVLLEAIGYIKFLQEQVQVLSTPYMKATSMTTTQADPPGKKSWNSEKNQDSDEPKLDLRSRGLCLVPVSCTLQVANENGADYWAPSLGAGYR